MRVQPIFANVHSEGGLLPGDLLARVVALDSSLVGLTPARYHLVEGERLNEAINRSWNRLVGAWTSFQDGLAKLPDDDRATTLTRTRWLLVLFQELGYGQLQAAKAYDIDDKSYPVSHTWGQVPIHLVGARIDVSRRTPGVAGAATMSPHGMVQEFLNRSTDHLWGFVSNGLQLRLLRDNVALTRQAYVEFDLQSIFDGQQYADFVLLWLLCHQSRVEGAQPHECVLEQWSTDAARQGTRALDQLRAGVEAAITALGTGFLTHPANADLRQKLQSGDLNKQEYYRQLLRLVYRLLFLFVAEDRGLLLNPSASPTAHERYMRYYSLGRIRDLAAVRRGGPHRDLWQQLSVVFSALGRPDGAPELGLPGLGSFLWSDAALVDLRTADLPNAHLLQAVHALSTMTDGNVRRSVDYRRLGSEELGSIYESLLELHPDLSVETKTFRLNTAAGNERKTTGSYYTPTSLITELLDSALDPVLTEAAAQPNPEAAILDLKVIDPACGSGHFLIAAAHRIAKRLAVVRTGDDEPSLDATRSALRDVIARCIHGIDLNPMAVELCKVSLWMESVEPGKPLSFLDHRIVPGNGLLGATPALLDAGVPDDAFKPLEGDDKAVVTSLKKRNKAAREGQGSLFGGETGIALAPLAAKAGQVDSIGDDTVAGVLAKAARWNELVNSPEYQTAVLAADTWCAAFVAPKVKVAPQITHAEFQLASSHPERVSDGVRAAVQQMVEQYGFLHWHLAFLDVYGGRGGFDVVLGNPPWEKVQFTEKEFFAASAPQIATLPGAKRKTAIQELQADDPELWTSYLRALRHADGESHFIRSSGRFPLCGLGRVNTYAVFAEVMRDAVAPTGRVGVIVPTGIATDDTTKLFFADLVGSRQLASLYDFENAGFFAGIAQGTLTRFSLVTFAGVARGVAEAGFVFFSRATAELDDPRRRFTLTPDDLALINPNTKTAPVFRTRRDAEVTKGVYRRVPVLVREGDPKGNPWGVEFQQGLFNMTSDSHLFRTADQLRSEGAELLGNVWCRQQERWLPLYEAKMIHQFDHRFGSYQGVDLSGTADIRALPSVSANTLVDPAYLPLPRYWVSELHFKAAQDLNPRDAWHLAFRDVTNATTNARTFVSSVVPPVGFGHVSPLIRTTDRQDAALLLPILNSFVVDYLARQKTSGNHMTFFIVKQLAVLPRLWLEHPTGWGSQVLSKWVAPRVLELSYTAWDLGGFAKDLGYDGPPFKWDPARRELLRAELDAAFFHLYGVERNDVDYIMDTFPIVRRKDEAAHREYRTKRLILERYDALAECIANGTEYQTILDPPPADPRVAHPESTRPEWAT